MADMPKEVREAMLRMFESFAHPHDCDFQCAFCGRYSAQGHHDLCPMATLRNWAEAEQENDDG